MYERGTAPRSPADAAAVEDESASDERTDRTVLCRQCRAAITSQRHVMEVNDQHQHTFFNPAGIIFEIGCFARADGCRVVGTPTTEFSWFAGHAWSYALCGSCQRHLGWFFQGAIAPSGFFGLVLNKLVVDES
ncbi:MAG: hypothetical protein JXR83_21805 [Deltaproteobacteria bacterium]|nr:hypothetical protein [Deltaproteobacteria bacterium]